MTVSDQVGISLLSWGPAQIVGIPLMAYSAAKGFVGLFKNKLDHSCYEATHLSNLCAKNLTLLNEQKKSLETLEKTPNAADFGVKLQAIVDKIIATRIQINGSTIVKDISGSNAQIEKLPNLRQNCLEAPKACFIGKIDNQISVEERTKLVIKDLKTTMDAMNSNLTAKKNICDSRRWQPEKSFSNIAFYGLSMIPLVGVLIASHLIPSYWDQ